MASNHQMRRGASGFTLIELMIVVAIIALLAAIAIPRFASMVRKAKEGATKGNLGAIRSALSVYYADLEGSYPDFMAGNDGLTVLTVNSKYISTIPQARIADYHPDSTTEVDLCIGGCPAVCFTCTYFPDGGEWAYYPASAPPMLAGQVTIDCTHSDTKASSWTGY